MNPSPVAAPRRLAGPVRVFLVDDSNLALRILECVLRDSPRVEVVGTAVSGVEALEMIPRLHPQVVCTDLRMPGMDGREFTRHVVNRFGLPILVVSAHVAAQDSVFELLEAGAVDVMMKPRGQGSLEIYAQELIAKIEAVAAARPGASASPVNGEARQLASARLGIAPLAPGSREAPPPSPETAGPDALRAAKVIAVGASTGGPPAIQRILGPLPRSFPVPILCVQHIGGEFLPGLIDWLDMQVPLRVKVAEPGELARPGTVYFPRGDVHLRVDAQGHLHCSGSERVDGHRPSVTATFHSVAQAYGAHGAGILLTGMGTDGARGLAAIARAGGVTVAQDESSSVVFGMPRAAIELGAAQIVLSLEGIAGLLQSRN